MRASRVVFTAPHRAELEEFTLDESLGPEDVLVKNRVSLISPGTELAAFTDQHQMPGRAENPYPMHVGYAAVGEVIAIGSQVKSLAPGDLVFTATGHASTLKFTVGESLPDGSQSVGGRWTRVPDEVEPAEAVFCRMAVVGMSTLVSCTARPGDWVAIAGLGLVGNLASQAFQASQMNVVAIEPSQFRRQKARVCGVEDVFEPAEAGLKEKVDEMSEPAGCTVGLDCTGKAEAVVQLARLLSSGAELVLIGTPWQSQSKTTAAELLQAVFFRYLRVRSGWEWHLPTSPEPFRHGSIAQNYRLALQWIAEGLLSVRPLLTHRLAPEQVQEGYLGLLEKPESYLGVVLDW